MIVRIRLDGNTKFSCKESMSLFNICQIEFEGVVLEIGSPKVLEELFFALQEARKYLF